MSRVTCDGGGVEVSIPIPLKKPGLFKHKATQPVLAFLTENPFSQYSQAELARNLSLSERSVRLASPVLIENDLVKVEKKAGKKLLSINREVIQRPENPYLRIPQNEFQDPVKFATDALLMELEQVHLIVLYGSVAKGQADRKSDIDLWILVEGDQAENQRQANKVRKKLEEMRFNGERYGFDISVESLQYIKGYLDEIRQIWSEGIKLYESDKQLDINNDLQGRLISN
ncbi:MAG: nucleotidyltransferase domain-containing protein [Halobacteria archaeon]